MDVGKRRVGLRSSVVVAGSVWESRMKHDEVRGGIKVFNGEESPEKQDQENVAKPKRPPAAKRKTWKSETLEGFEKNPIQIARGKSEEKKNSDEQVKEMSISVEGNKKSPVQPRRRRSEGNKEIGIRRSPRTELAKPKSDVVKVSVEENKDVVEEIEKSPVEKKSEEIGSESDEACKEFGVCEEKVISSSVEDSKSEPKDDDERESEEEIGEEIEVEVEKKSIEVKEIEKPIEEKPNKFVSDCEVKKVNFERRQVKKFHQFQNQQKKAEPISLNVEKQPPVLRRATLHSSFVKGSPTKSPPTSNEYHSFPETHSRLQSFVDLIMWKDISRSVFIFGIGTFTILSSSYTKDLNISFISVMSYLGLVYLAAIFLFTSIVYRGVIDIDYTSYVLGEEEAIWLLKLVLPYLNEFLLKLKALFSGDPATTMKLAVLLFVLARCGSSITIWTMAKLGFFGVFTVPKVCSLYSRQITAYGKFWVRRFRDAWDSCSHKKAVTVAVFLLVWNLSSIVARIWAVFMLYVAFRYYQQTLVRDDWVEDDAEGEETWHEPIGGQRQGHGSIVVDNNTKQKKRS
ncbi:reticulon-like protein B21 [Morus notabilis]|uniref:reticulon-like protein B21 n=1 Tax=Morus notabilis TaxID=981085 RepID=UPI000CED100B|nr:reticulon-like protein B21 [Morus notabilis]